MTGDMEAFLEAAAALADERGYHRLSEEELLHRGDQVLLDCVAVYAALGAKARKHLAGVISERLGYLMPLRS